MLLKRIVAARVYHAAWPAAPPWRQTSYAEPGLVQYCHSPYPTAEPHLHARVTLRYLIPLALLVLATTLEAGGDAIIRVGLRSHPVPLRLALMLAGTAVLYGYGLTLNLAPLDWGRLIGAYVATFFVVGQVINLIAFHSAPSLPIVVGGLFIVAGGAIITAWVP